MYFWNTKKLAIALAEDAVNQKEQFKYYLATTLAFTISSTPTGGKTSGSVFFDLIFMIIITIFGIRHCYNVNSDGDNREFILRILCVGWPLGIRVFLTTLALLFTYFIVGGIVILGPSERSEFFYNVNVITPVMIISLIIFYWRLANHIKFISNYNNSSSEGPLLNS